MHGNGKLRQVKRALLFTVGKAPYPAQNLVGQSGTFEDGFCGFPWDKVRQLVCSDEG